MLRRVERDSVDLIVQAWRRRDPQLDSSTLEVIGRLLLCAEYFERTARAVLQRFDLSIADFDVLNALRRIGDRHGSKPSDLARSSLITTGAMTARLDRLEQAGLHPPCARPRRPARRACLSHRTGRQTCPAGASRTDSRQPRIPRAAQRAAARLPRVRAQDAAPAPRTQMSWVRARVQRRRSAVTAATDAAVAILPLVACGLQPCKTVRRQVGAARPQSLAMSSGIRPQPWGLMPFAGKVLIPG